VFFFFFFFFSKIILFFFYSREMKLKIINFLYKMEMCEMDVAPLWPYVDPLCVHSMMHQNKLWVGRD